MRLLINRDFSVAVVLALLAINVGAGAVDAGNSNDELILKFKAQEMRFKKIPAGTCVMGSEQEKEAKQYFDAHPHQIEISEDYYLAVYEVTQAQWSAIMGYNPSWHKGVDHPVENVSWLDAVKFCQLLEKESGGSVRLPTEAEWEYACRAGAKTAFSFGDSMSAKDACYYAGADVNGGTVDGPKPQHSSKVGSYKPNDFGLFDMHGNVTEWCLDWYDENYYTASPKTDPKGPKDGMNKVIRGGSWMHFPWMCRSSTRDDGRPTSSSFLTGFRVLYKKNKQDEASPPSTPSPK